MIRKKHKNIRSTATPIKEKRIFEAMAIDPTLKKIKNKTTNTKNINIKILNNKSAISNKHINPLFNKMV